MKRFADKYQLVTANNVESFLAQPKSQAQMFLLLDYMEICRNKESFPFPYASYDPLHFVDLLALCKF